jgi:hypothetical protein
MLLLAPLCCLAGVMELAVSAVEMRRMKQAATV